MADAGAATAATARVALVVIARDEAPRIQRLLKSVAPWVDEMLVLDTGSRDDTVALAQASGARVEHFRWCDDFAAARNAALAHANAEWHLVLDADEWLMAGGPALQALRHTPLNFVGSIELIDHFTDAPQGPTRHAHTRLSRVLPGSVRYAGRIHEQPQHALPVCVLPLRVGHDGYLPERLQAKRGRNRVLLEQAVAQAPQDAYLWYQLGKDCSVYDEHAQAEQAFAQAAVLQPPAQGWWLDLVARRLFTLKCLGRHAQGLQVAQAAMSDCSVSPDFFFALGDLLLDWAATQPELAPELLPMMEQAWRQCLELGEHPELPGAVAGRGSHLAAHNLALVLDATARPEEAATLRGAYIAPKSAAGAIPGDVRATPAAKVQVHRLAGLSSHA